MKELIIYGIDTWNGLSYDESDHYVKMAFAKKEDAENWIKENDPNHDYNDIIPISLFLNMK